MIYVMRRIRKKSAAQTQFLLKDLRYNAYERNSVLNIWFHFRQERFKWRTLVKSASLVVYRYAPLKFILKKKQGTIKK